MQNIKWDGKKNQGLSLETDPDDYVIVLNASGCRKCKTTAVSRYRHEYAECECGAIAVDGGLEYFRFVGDIDNAISLNITASPEVRNHIRMVTNESPIIRREIEARNKAVVDQLWSADKS